MDSLDAMRSRKRHTGIHHIIVRLDIYESATSAHLNHLGTVSPASTFTRNQRAKRKIVFVTDFSSLYTARNQ